MARILVIDDDLDLLEMMRMMLQRGGHEAILTGDGMDGIVKAQQLHPDLAIVDVMMPGMNGYQVVRKLREDPATADIAVLVLSARAQSVDREAALAARANAYMAKPVSPAELLQIVTDLLERRSQASLPTNLMMSVFSLRGGVGTTTVAVNLALTLQQAGRQVCLADLCQKSGHAAIQIRQQAKMTWADALLQINNLSPEALDQILLRHDSGLRVLASPFLPPVRPPAGEAIARLLAMLKAAFGATVVDLGTFDDAGRATILSSDFVLLVLTPEVASLQTTAATLRTIKGLNVPDDRVLLVSNQVALRPGLSPAAIEKALGRNLFANLPYDEAQIEALGRGVPLMPGQSSSPLAAGVRQLVQALAAIRAAHAQPSAA
jgi:Flp pilus assembly CpaE family ATPase